MGSYDTREEAGFLELSVGRHLFLLGRGRGLDRELARVDDDDVLGGAVVPALGNILCGVKSVP